MARLGNTFNATEHDTEQRDYEELPNGDYQLEIEASDIVPTSTGSGTILKTTIVVIAPEALKGRKLFNNYNLENANAKTQEIGQRQFASLCRAIGVDSVEDSEELHFRAFTAKIGLGKPSKDGKYPARAEIKKYYFPDEGNVPEPAIDANQPQPAAPVTRAQVPANDNRQAAGRPAPAAAAAGGTRRPWGSK
ncbi:hypothetical protein CO659_12890 [Rhizobium sp. S9]|uniref:DUF669 domain-containing protein n=1 Tax=Rhizobium sp. S9 TaxID=2035454 RepID=UPI000BEA2D2C|nr:DUF669 domain-containing protein [Rhizobium sp. S9]PDS97551.1 hypothetical protein CO659_12890 [Rhizobium sp. S9]